ncbi:MAG TPA: hypothetical protein VFQ45_02755 [Longimicrobium sp.]|nr:hypothetical protein [Longimicrobium sp.]
MEPNARIAAVPLLVIGFLALAACAEGVRNPLADEAPPAHRTVAAATQEQIGQELARALAAGLADPGARARLRNAMRRSRTVEHKLLLHEFAGTGEGADFLAAASRGSGVAESVLSGWIAALPALDFYLPVLEHRLSWRAGADVVLGLNLDVNDPTLRAYTPTGDQIFLDSRHGVPAQAVLILHPAEPRLYVPEPAAADGETVQTAGDATTAEYEAGCSVEEGWQPVDNLCDGASGNVDGIVYGSGTLQQFTINGSDGWGRLEVIFQGRSSSGEKLWEYRRDGIERARSYTADFSFSPMGSYTSLVELDSWFTGSDDQWGRSYPSTTAFLNGRAGYGSSNGTTFFITSCGAYFGSFWILNCPPYDEVAFFEPKTTGYAVFVY